MKTDLLEAVESTSEYMDFADGKYTVVNENGELSALRYGEPWARDLVGDNLVYSMLVDAMALKQQRDSLLGILIRARDAIEALDGTSVENERLVDDYRAVIDKTMKTVQSSTDQLKTALLEALKQIHKQPMPRAGICHQLSLACDDASESYWRNKIQSLTYKWPKFSGSIDYPVPHPTESPCGAYAETENMWDRRTEYGRARWDLLEFCISELEKELCDGES